MGQPLFDEAFLRNLERLAILSRKTLAGQLQGERRSTRRGQSVEFSDFRPYAAGDDFRRIDWNAYARLERFFIKLFIEEEDLTVHLLVDASRSMDWGEPNKLDYARQLAGALGYIALVGLDRVTVTLLGNRTLRPLRGKRQALEMFTFLQSLTPGAGNPALQLRNYAANARPPGPAMVVSDLMDDGWLEGIGQLAGRGFETTVLHVLSPDEHDPLRFGRPPLSGDFKLVDAESQSAVEITADFETLTRYQQHKDEWQHRIQEYCQRRGAHYVPVVTSLPLQDLLFSWLQKQGILR